jgi:hypothetical protein
MSDVPETPSRPALPAWQFSLGGILLVMTLIAACRALMRLAPLPGFLLTVVCVPAAMWTAVGVPHYARRGERLRIADKVGLFVASVLIVLLMEFATCVTGMVVATLFFWLLLPLVLLFQLKPEFAVGLVCLPGIVATMAALPYFLWKTGPGSHA